LSIITLISVLGVMLGVTVLILVISVMTGFDRELRQKVIDFDAHILVTTEDVLRDWRALKAKIDNTPGVVATAPYVQGPVIAEFEYRRLAPLIRGIDPAEEEKVVALRKFIKLGALNLDGESVVLGSELARKLQIAVGDKLTVYSPGNLGQILDSIKKLENAKDVTSFCRRNSPSQASLRPATTSTTQTFSSCRSTSARNFTDLATHSTASLLRRTIPMLRTRLNARSSNFSRLLSMRRPGST
ncbi:MAG: hypothetical protein DME34_04535, partial [Verrucomicrobia bacterium]